MKRVCAYLLGLSLVFPAVQPVLAAGGEAAVSLDRVEAMIKGKAPEGEMERQVRALNASAKEVFQSTDQIRASNTIYVNHCRSIIQEIFYHLNQIAPYYDFKDAIYLRKLQELKANKARMERGEITKAQFGTNVEKIEARYRQELADAQEFIDEKVDRLSSLCTNLKINTDSIRENLRAKGVNGLPDDLRSRVLQLKQDPTWQAVSLPTERGMHMQKALEAASDGQGLAVKGCLSGLFDFFEQKAYGPVFDEGLVARVVGQF